MKNVMYLSDNYTGCWSGVQFEGKAHDFIVSALTDPDHGPAAEAWRWNARAWPGNTELELSIDKEVCPQIKDVNKSFLWCLA